MTQMEKDGGQAFPTHPILYSSEDAGQAQGMSLRDWFAGQALVGLAHPGWEADPIKAPAKAYEVADAMMAARVQS